MANPNVVSPSLHELQRWMRWVITDPRGVDPALADPKPETAEALKFPRRYTEPTRRLLSTVSDHPPLGAADRLSIYAEGYFTRLVESLGSDFAALKQTLGEESFLKLTADYLKAFPSQGPNIGEAGERLPEFLKTHVLGLEHPELVALARLEWAVIESFYADEHPSPARLNPAALTRIAPEAWADVRFELDASVRLLNLDYTVEKIWYKRHDEALLTAAIEELGPCDTGSGVLLFRNAEGLVEVERLERASFAALHGMGLGEKLAEICEKLVPNSAGELPPITQWFSKWIASGVIATVSAKGDSC